MPAIKSLIASSALIALIWGLSADTATAARRHADHANPNCAQDLTLASAHIARVTDGDTVVLTDNRRVRLIGINTLEMNEPHSEHRQAASAAKNALIALLPANEPVLLYIGEESHDRHQRLLAHVIRKSDHLAVAPVLLAKGHAMQSAVAPNTRCADYFAALEQAARQQKLGVWQLANSLTTKALSTTKQSRGFKLITGTVTHVRTQTRHTQLMLDDRVAVLLRPALAAQFDNQQNLPMLMGRKVEVRGWLNRKKNNIRLWLQHTANLRTLDE